MAERLAQPLVLSVMAVAFGEDRPHTGVWALAGQKRLQGAFPAGSHGPRAGGVAVGHQDVSRRRCCR